MSQLISLPKHVINIVACDEVNSIQVLSYNSLVVAYQNVPITSILTNYTLGSWKDFDVDLSLIGSKEIIWKICYDWNTTSQEFYHNLRVK